MSRLSPTANVNTSLAVMNEKFYQEDKSKNREKLNESGHNAHGPGAIRPSTTSLSSKFSEETSSSSTRPTCSTRSRVNCQPKAMAQKSTLLRATLHSERLTTFPVISGRTTSSSQKLDSSQQGQSSQRKPRRSPERSSESLPLMDSGGTTSICLKPATVLAIKSHLARATNNEEEIAMPTTRTKGRAVDVLKGAPQAQDNPTRAEPSLNTHRRTILILRPLQTRLTRYRMK